MRVFTLNALMQGLVLGEAWKNKRMKAMCFHPINIAGRVIHRARQWVIRLGAGHGALELLVLMCERIALISQI